MDRRTVRFRLGILVGAVWTACVLPFPRAVGHPTMPPAGLDQLGVTAQELEKEGQWVNACVLYERMLREDRTFVEAKEGYQRCLRHILQGRRHRDPTFRDSLLARKPSQAIEVYEEVLNRLQAAYINRDKVNPAVLFRHGLDEFRFALEDETFAREYLGDASPEELRAFRARLEEWRHRDIHTTEDASRQVLEVVQAARKAPFRLKPAVVVLEFACGACNSLDEYTAYLTPGYLSEVQASLKGHFVGIGVELEVIDQKLFIAQVIPNSPASQNGLKPRDRILRIDRKFVDDLSAEIALARLRGEPGTLVELEIVPQGEMTARTFKLERQPVRVPSVVDIKFDGGIGYFRLLSFQETTLQELREAILRLQMAGLRVLVMDLRGNPGGEFKVAVQVAELFVGDGVVVKTRSRLPEYNKIYQVNNPAALTVPLVLLVDGDTASAAEVVAGALKERRGATLVGQTTFGKGSIQRVLPLTTVPAGIRITIAQFYSPTNYPYNGQGVSPHIPVILVPGMDDTQRNAAWQQAQQMLEMGMIR